MNTNAEENTLKAFSTIKDWLYNTSPTDCPQVTAIQRFHISPKTKLSKHYPGNIILVQQFYLDCKDTLNRVQQARISLGMRTFGRQQLNRR